MSVLIGATAEATCSIRVGGADRPPDTAWSGINANTGFYTSSGYYSKAETLALDLNCSAIRMGVDGVAGASDGAGFAFAKRDAVVASHREAGLKIHAVLDPRTHVSHGANQADWNDNWRHFCAGVFAHYDGSIDYYILGNEWDLNGLTAAQTVAFAQIAMEERNRVNTGIVLESDPSLSPEASSLRSSINLGLTRYVDILGVHNYGAQINEGRLDTPWDFMKAAKAASGYPVIPVAASESGTNITWPKPSGWTQREYQGHWFAQNRLQLRRYGYDHVDYYSLNSTVGGNVFDIADIGTNSPWAITEFRPCYDIVQAMNVDKGLRNGGFESANDRDADWVICWEIDQTASQPAEWARVSFFTDGANARTGSGYMRLRCGATTRVRQVIELLIPGTEYTITAHAKLSASGPTARLRAYGYNHLDGQELQSAQTTTSGSYQRLQVTFKPSKTWVVVSLEATGGSSGQFCYWDDVTIA